MVDSYHKWRSCESKVAHSRWSAAAREAGRMNARHGTTLYRAYLCPYCGWYHVGRRKNKWTPERVSGAAASRKR